MAKKIVEINYKFSGTREDFEKENLPYASPIAETSKLLWKIWIIDEKKGEAGGVYLFEDDASVKAFLDGPIITDMKSDPSLIIKVFDVMEEHTNITRGPIK